MRYAPGYEWPPAKIKSALMPLRGARVAEPGSWPARVG